MSELNDAIPLLDVVASSPATVIILPDTVVSIPSPAVSVNVSPRLAALAVPEEAAMLIKLLSICVLPIEAIDTAPDVTLKSAVANDAIPLLVVVASSPVMLILLFDTVVLIPSPASNVIVSPSVILSVDPVSAAIFRAHPVDVTYQ